MRKRHWGVLTSFIAIVLVPLFVVAIYLWAVADDRYGSTTGFSVRQSDETSSSDILGGLTQFTGGSSSPDSDVLYQFIRSQNLALAVDKKLHLRTYFSSHWKSDPAYALWPDATAEDLHWYWGRVVRVTYNQSSGLLQIDVHTFTPDMAQKIAQEIVDESTKMVNGLNDLARADAIRYADSDLEKAQEQLREAREKLTEFRTRTQIVDLQSDIQGRMGVTNNLQQQLAQELVALDQLAASTSADDPRVTQAKRRIQAIRERIATERKNLATTIVPGTGKDYPALMSEFEGLTVDQEFAEKVYRAALTARDSAYDSAQRQTRYLATYITPTLADSPEYPQRAMIFGLAALFLLLSWGIIVLIYYSIRDRG
ncbi:sugar transporter [Thioclava sp.]|uniref:sugar transporter n=1 Tax=Thioclava sp. TaxID=1933450 RepID=UPI003AA7D61F